MHTANGRIAFWERFRENCQGPNINSITKPASLQLVLQSLRFKMPLCLAVL